jgi:hypothetical protein
MVQSELERQISVEIIGQKALDIVMINTGTPAQEN